MTPDLFESLQSDAMAVRKALLRMHFENSSAHIGTGLSSIEILVYLYRVWLKGQDQFILSKGHGASALYAVLHRVGILSDEEIATYYKDGTRYPAHPMPLAHPAITAATGSLGHGLPIAAGLAFAHGKLSGKTARVACLLSDGECNEGSVWEAAAFAAHHRLTNLAVWVDVNGLQGFGRTEDVLNMEPFAEKWRAFGFQTLEVDGHDFSVIHEALAGALPGKPLCILAKTVKGKGVDFMEGKLEWHYLSLKKEMYERALQSLERSGRSS